MIRTTKIEWTEVTWNPFVGCSIVSAGCTHCYAMKAARRIEQRGVPAYQGTTKKTRGGAVWTGRVNRASDAALRKPLGVRTPSMIFVNSMSDFWHEDADDAWRREALDVMRQTPRHEYQVLTKRPELINPILERMGETLPGNVWMGVSIENAKVKHRIDTLRGVRASIRFLSVEPLIGPVGDLDLSGIHWVITGGESGPGARPMQAAWVRAVRDACREQKVPHFFKQWGLWQNNPVAAEAPKGVSPEAWVQQRDPDGKGGSLLDGRKWQEYPRRPGGTLL